MTTHCPYCGDSLADDDYDAHLRREHAAELGPIDRRRVGQSARESGGRSLALYAGVGLLLALFVVGYALVFLGPGAATSSAAVQPDASTPTHEHGTITVQYDGTEVAFEDPQYAEIDDCFHFHDYATDGVWHVHCENVTIEYALETLGMDVTADSFAIDGESFSEDDGDTVSVIVNGEAVDPQTYELQGVASVDEAGDGAGDHVEIVAESAD